MTEQPVAEPSAPIESWAFRVKNSVNMHRFRPGTTEQDAYQDAQERASALRQPVLVYRRPDADPGLRFGPEWVRHGHLDPGPGREPLPPRRWNIEE